MALKTAYFFTNKDLKSQIFDTSKIKELQFKGKLTNIIYRTCISLQSSLCGYRPPALIF